MIGKRIRHLNRYRDIAVALTRHGFGFIVEELDIFHFLSLPHKAGGAAQKDEKYSIAERIRLVVQDLGPTFIKLGQIASTRSDIIPDHIIAELQKLQDQVAPFAFDEVQKTLESQLRITMADTFSRFESEPLAAASIGQVHLAVLQDGQPVAVKIQRPGIGQTVRTDLEILQNLAVLAEARFKWAKQYQIHRMAQEFSRALRDELDYTIEGHNAEKIANQFKKDPHVHVPKVYWEYTSKKILTTEFVEGIKLNDPDRLLSHGYEPQRIAERFMNAMLHQIFMEGFFHADPHPGNLMVLPGEVLTFIDFGLVGRLTPAMKRHFANLIIALLLQSSEGVIRAILGMRLVQPDVDMTELRRDIDMLRDKYVGIPFHEISLGESVNDLLNAAYRHQVQVPSEFVLLGKTLITAEGVVRQLDPDISIIEIAEPFGRLILKERLNPKSIMENLKEDWFQFSDILAQLPQHVRDLISLVRGGTVDVSIPEFDMLLNKLDRIGNRIAFSIVLLSFSIVMTGIIVVFSLNRQRSLFWHMPVLEIGALTALIMFGWLIHSIFRSGRF
ncbi:ABC1 kinase family protein [Paenibacillus xerothermodurans]|uniref:AarF/ABC1/UbiB kinase family protein n=1 Tax=Paenibacillus xerothermodurans TaxID=1977292 RepID=A0A2W1NVF3_PAEXE|nr:AarF/ABC1/UbiB kinase family protein [Paenibacillus xerothermodurans]PZE19672.1 AarF/ABC1/UbiB kinase family protein [Paenibacillus xerothermodurans]